MTVAERSGKVHALVIGISRYSHLRARGAPTERSLGLRPLNSGALSAYRVFEWLNEADELSGRRMGSVRLLVAPSRTEMQAEPALREHTAACTLKAIQTAAAEWRRDAATDKDNLAFFYFAGHGVQREGSDHVLLLQDFGDGAGPLLDNAIDSASLIGGMALSKAWPDMALTQWYLLDACRMRPAAFVAYQDMKSGAVWDRVQTTNSQRREMRRAIVHTAVDGSSAFAKRGRQSAFSEALLACLRGGAARMRQDGSGTWEVTITSLQDALNDEFEQIARDHGITQHADWSVVGGGPFVIRRLTAPPLVEVEVELDPEEAQTCTVLELRDSEERIVHELRPPWKEHPFKTQLPGGTYLLRAEISPKTPPFVARKLMPSFDPPRRHLQLRVVA